MRVPSSILSLAGALGFALAASSAGAQGYGPYYDRDFAEVPEQMIVSVPSYGPTFSKLGAPIENVSLSRPVRINDLDLRTARGVRILRDRIRFTANTLCNRLDDLYPVSVEGGSTWPIDARCYHRAVSDAMAQADIAIRRARANVYIYEP